MLQVTVHHKVHATLFLLSMALLLASCSDNNSHVEANIKMYTHVWDEILNKRNIDMIDTHFASNYVNKTVTSTVSGLADAKKYYGAFLTGFSDIKFEVEEIFGKDDRLVKRWTFSGTHSGEFSGIAPTGKRITVRGVSIARITDGKIAEEIDYMDDLGFMQQLGVIPSSEK
jgi:steroid delta-isomerase-like uncharacterized protein